MENKKTVGGCQLSLNYVFTKIKKSDQYSSSWKKKSSFVG